MLNSPGASNSNIRLGLNAYQGQTLINIVVESVYYGLQVLKLNS
jgi:hypothetical protein